MTPTRRAGHFAPDDHILVPRDAFLPPAVEPRPERVLHVALDSPTERQPSLCAALASLGPYRHFDWVVAEEEDRLARDLLANARDHRPTLVFMQLQRETAITGEVVRQLKADCPEATVVNWDGDYHFEPDSPERAWFVELGRACDASLVTNTRHPGEYAQLGVRFPGYLQVGVDDRYFQDRPPVADVPRVVLLGSRYEAPGYERRVRLVERLSRELGPAGFGTYGGGWVGACARQPLKQDEEPPVYRAARAAISISRICDTPRYTSDRLFRAMASGAVTLVERFPEMESLGLVDHDNCMVWSSLGELTEKVDLVEGTWRAAGGEVKNLTKIREAARWTAYEYHTWHVRMRELAAVLEAVRR